MGAECADNENMNETENWEPRLRGLCEVGTKAVFIVDLMEIGVILGWCAWAKVMIADWLARWSMSWAWATMCRS